MEKGFAVVSCYEAGPMGFWLHRQLTGMGVTTWCVRRGCGISRSRRGRAIAQRLACGQT
jgi:hypothetical protein